jgi:hypothetical protein
LGWNGALKIVKEQKTAISDSERNRMKKVLREFFTDQENMRKFIELLSQEHQTKEAQENTASNRIPNLASFAHIARHGVSSSFLSDVIVTKL